MALSHQRNAIVYPRGDEVTNSAIVLERVLSNQLVHLIEAKRCNEQFTTTVTNFGLNLKWAYFIVSYV